ncbi:MAG: DUF5681 domain-containing protein [Vibrionaceae bacterium]
MPFVKGQTGNPRGRPKGSTNKDPVLITDEMARDAIAKLKAALEAGEPWAIKLVIEKKISNQQ